MRGMGLSTCPAVWLGGIGRTGPPGCQATVLPPARLLRNRGAHPWRPAWLLLRWLCRSPCGHSPSQPFGDTGCRGLLRALLGLQQSAFCSSRYQSGNHWKDQPLHAHSQNEQEGLGFLRLEVEVHLSLYVVTGVTCHGCHTLSHLLRDTSSARGIAVA